MATHPAILIASYASCNSSHPRNCISTHQNECKKLRLIPHIRTSSNPYSHTHIPHIHTLKHTLGYCFPPLRFHPVVTVDSRNKTGRKALSEYTAEKGKDGPEPAAAAKEDPQNAERSSRQARSIQNVKTEKIMEPVYHRRNASEMIRIAIYTRHIDSLLKGSVVDSFDNEKVRSSRV
jgi:hypothetical protein